MTHLQLFLKGSELRSEASESSIVVCQVNSVLGCELKNRAFDLLQLNVVLDPRLDV